MRYAEYTPPPGPPPVTTDGTRLVWAAFSCEWQTFQSVCPDCLTVAPMVFPEGLCAVCVEAVRAVDRAAAAAYRALVAMREKFQAEAPTA